MTTDPTEPPIPDLRSMLAEASRPAASVTVPMKQGLAEQIAAAEEDLAVIAADAPPGRMGAKSPLKAAAERVEALRAEMAGSALTFRFVAPGRDAAEQVRIDMGGRDDDEEQDLRWTAASCAGVEGPDGQPYGERMTWEDFRDLRVGLGEPIYLATIKATSDRVWRREWSVPFSPAASHILGTAK